MGNTHASLMYVDIPLINGETLDAFKVTNKNSKKCGVRKTYCIGKIGRNLQKQERVDVAISPAHCWGL